MKRSLARGLQSFSLRFAAPVAAALATVTSHADADFKKFQLFGDDKFGANITFSAADWLYPNKYILALDGEAVGTVLGYKLPAAKGETKFEIDNTSTSVSSGYLTLFGTKLANWNQRLTGNTTFRTQPFLARQAGGQMKAGIGPVNVTLKATAEASTYAAGSQLVEYSLKRPPVKTIKAGPAFDAAASGTVSADIWVLGAGLDAALKLAGYSLNSNVRVTPREAGKTPAVQYLVTADTMSTMGYLKGWVRIGISGFLSKTYKKTFAEYNGGPSSATLVQGTR